jgi:hypothetical protein
MRTKVFGTPMNADVTPMNADKRWNGNGSALDFGNFENVETAEELLTFALSAFIGVTSAFIGVSKDFCQS